MNDVSARDLQRNDGQWLRAKSTETFAPMGPFLVTKNDLGTGDGLHIQLRLNGQTAVRSRRQVAVSGARRGQQARWTTLVNDVDSPPSTAYQTRQPTTGST